MSADSWRLYNKGVPYLPVAVPPAKSEPTVDEILSQAFDRLAQAYPVRPEMPVHQATADTPTFLKIEASGDFRVVTAQEVYRKAKTAKNSRRAAARWRHRLARRLGKPVSELSYEDMSKAGFKLRRTREDGGPARGAPELAAATPAPAPELAPRVITGVSEKGEPGPADCGHDDYDATGICRTCSREEAEKAFLDGFVSLPLPCRNCGKPLDHLGRSAYCLACQQRIDELYRQANEIMDLMPYAQAGRTADEMVGLVPLPEKPEPRERPFVPNKFGEHGND